jgi:beta-galactosidase/beta-glucuronidase
LGKDANGYTRIMLNNEPLFQFGLLDQGWWPDGLYTPPTEEAMLYDIQVTKDLGFNMLRKHVKVEPARFYYHCDKMGMLVWQDMPSGFSVADRGNQHVKHDALIDWERPKESAVQFEKELKAMIDNFYAFPSILVWVPINEGWGQYDMERLAEWVKTYDPSRLVDAPSGWADRKVGDMIDVHLYPGPGMELPEENRASVLGEFGGLGWPVDGHLWWDKRNWGYLTYQDQETFRREFKSIIEKLQGLISWGLSAAIYTQTTDVEGEVNGLLTYDREVLKLDPQETREMIKPLYQSWWNKHILISDSEHKAQEWRVNFEKPDNKWADSGYDDFLWEKEKAPFSASVNPFLPSSTDWQSKKLYARKTFNLDAVPQNLFLKYYAPKTEVKVYLNGNLVQELQDGGGRKRHYTHILLNNASQYLTTGKNVLAVEVDRKEDIGAFDLGLYTTGAVSKEVSAQPAPEMTGSLERQNR